MTTGEIPGMNPPAKLRALVVDDAAVMRRLVTEVLRRDPMIEVAGTAADGREALAQVEKLRPDFVTLDLEMPEMDGLETLRALRRSHPRLPVIMFSLATRRGALATLDALAGGASDYVTKPSASTGLEESLDRLERELLPKIHVHWRRAAAPGPAPAAMAAPGTGLPLRRRETGVATAIAGASRAPGLLCIATSTGGPNALVELFSHIREPLAVPVLVVQHMPPMFTTLLAERLDHGPGAVRWSEARHGETLRAGHAYLAPGGLHLAVAAGPGGLLLARLLETEPENSCRPSADVLFRSVAALATPALAVVMTGMGEDGLRGCELLAARGDTILVQDQAGSVVWGMPGAVARAGLASAELSLAALAEEIVHRCARPLAFHP